MDTVGVSVVLRCASCRSRLPVTCEQVGRVGTEVAYEGAIGPHVCMPVQRDTPDDVGEGCV